MGGLGGLGSMGESLPILPIPILPILLIRPILRYLLLQMPAPDDIIELPIDGVLDLHTFHPSEVKELVGDYLVECQKLGILEVRIIHGKGKGVLRRIVQSVLDKHPAVASYQLGGHGSGGWGATTVDLRPLTHPPRTDR